MRIATPGLAVAAVLLLSACTSTNSVLSPTPTPSESEAAVPTVVEPPGPLPADVVLVVTATATASNGAEVALELRVRRTVPFDDVAAQTVPQAITAACPDEATLTRFAQENWGFTRVNISAYPGVDPTTSWPEDQAIALVPDADDQHLIAVMSFLIDASESEACLSSKLIPGPGKGAISIGILGDTFETSGTTRWSELTYGFQAPQGVTLTNCEAQVTELGLSLGGAARDWTPEVGTQMCVAGS